MNIAKVEFKRRDYIIIGGEKYTFNNTDNSYATARENIEHSLMQDCIRVFFNKKHNFYIFIGYGNNIYIEHQLNLDMRTECECYRRHA